MAVTQRTRAGDRDNHDLSRSIGARLREWRYRRGLKQITVSQEVGVAQASVSNYELGKREIPLPVLLRFLAVLNVSLNEVIDASLLGDSQEVIVPRHSALGNMIHQFSCAASPQPADLGSTVTTLEVAMAAFWT